MPSDATSSALRDRTTIATLDPSRGQLPESVTLDEAGNFYLSISNTVQKLTPGGQLSLFAQLPTPAGTFASGVKFGPDGQLYVCNASFNPADDASWVFRISASGTVAPVAHLDAQGFPNDLAFDEDGNVYVTDSFLGQLWKIDRSGHASVWLKDALLAGNAAQPNLIIHLFGADGIAIDEDRRNLYVGNLDYGRIVRVPIEQSGAAGLPKVFASDARLAGADGIAFDRKGSLYVAVNGQDQLARVDEDGSVTVIAQGPGLDSPSSVVFGTQHSDRKTLYFSNFAILRAVGVRPGSPQPSVMALPVQFSGLELP